MLKTTLKFFLVGSALLIALPACTGLPAAVPTLNPNSINTAIAETMAVASTQTAEVGVPITGGSATPTPTPTVTMTPTTVLSPTPAFTSTPSTVQVSVSVATNCRTGPGIAFTRVGGLQVGQVAEVVGRNSNNTYWIIRNPNQSGQTCWLWGQFATLTGNTGALPIFTPPAPPPPTATPSPTITLTPATTSTAPSPTTSPTLTPTP